MGTLFTTAEVPEDGDAGGTGDDLTRLPVDLTAALQVALAEAVAAHHDWIGESGQPDCSVIRGDDRRVAALRASFTDPDASLMRYRGLDLGDHDHSVVDGKAQIVLATLVTPAEVMENLPMRDLLWRVCFRWKLRPRQVTGDTTSGTTENIVASENVGIWADVPLPDFDHRTAFFGREAFTYESAADVYHCPGGQALRFRKHKHTKRTRVSQAPAVAGHAGVRKGQCTTSTKGRQLKRSFDEADLDRFATVTRQRRTKVMRNRQVWAEPLVAEATAWHGRSRFRLRGHLGDLREHIALPGRLVLRGPRFCLQLPGALLHRGPFLGREACGRLVDRAGALGGLLCDPVLSPLRDVLATTRMFLVHFPILPVIATLTFRHAGGRRGARSRAGSSCGVA